MPDQQRPPATSTGPAPSVTGRPVGDQSVGGQSVGDQSVSDRPTPDQSVTHAPVTGRDRLVAALRRPGGRGQVTAALLLAALGFAAVVQVRSNSQDAEYVGARQDELINLINSLSLASERAENEIAQLEQTRSSLLNDTQARRTALERARQRADELGILAGTLPAIGPGIRVTIKDPDGAVGSNNLINGIQELRDAGAEAIELNDTVRVVAQTSLRDGAGGGVVIDGETITAPYVIDAIGGHHNLASALELRRGFSYEVERVGGEVAVESSESVEVASVQEPPQSQYAEPVPTE